MRNRGTTVYSNLMPMLKNEENKDQFKFPETNKK
jgi:hypothetical protein